MEIARAKERETAELKAQIDAIIAQRERLDFDVVMAETDLRAARSEAERAAAQAKISEVRRHQKALQERLDTLKAGAKHHCPPDNPLCANH